MSWGVIWTNSTCFVFCLFCFLTWLHQNVRFMDGFPDILSEYRTKFYRCYMPSLQHGTDTLLEKRMQVHSRNSPKVLIHGLEEELIVGFIEDLFKVQQCDLFRGDGDLHQVRRLLFVDMIDYFGFRHFLCSFPCVGPTKLTFQAD